MIKLSRKEIKKTQKEMFELTEAAKKTFQNFLKRNKIKKDSEEADILFDIFYNGFSLENYEEMFKNDKTIELVN